MFKPTRLFVGRALFTVTMLIATTWLINHSNLGQYLRLGQYYFSMYISGEHNQEAQAGEILMYMGFATAMALIALFSVWLSKTVREERALMLILIILAFIFANVVFYKEAYGFEVMYLSDTPLIWMTVIVTATLILSEFYFLLIRPLRKETQKKT